MISLNKIFQSIPGLPSLSPIFFPKGSLAALSKDGQILASAGPGNDIVQYVHRPTQSQKNICTATVSALYFRPNDKQYQQRGPAREITRNELFMACRQANHVSSYIPSLDSFVKLIQVQQPTALAGNATGQLLAIGTALGDLLVFDLTSQDLSLVFSTRVCPGPLAQVLFGIDGEHIFIRSEDNTAYIHRLNIEYEECGNYLKAGGSVHLRSRLKASSGQPKKINDLAEIFPARVSHISVHPTIRQVALAAEGNRIYFWNYACATLSHFSCPLESPAGFFCAQSDQFLVSSKEGLAAYALTRRQKRVASSTAAGGPYPVHYEIVLRADERPRIFANPRAGYLVRALVEDDGACITACS